MYKYVSGVFRVSPRGCSRWVLERERVMSKWFQEVPRDPLALEVANIYKQIGGTHG